MRVSGLLLAAGASTRFGAPKMLALVDGEPVLRRSVRAFAEAGLSETIVVLGAQADDVSAALIGLPVRTVVNERWADGMFGSVLKGLGAVTGELAAVSPADLPWLTADAVRRVVAAADGQTITVPSVDGRRGHPVVFPAALIPRLLTWPRTARLSDLFQQSDLPVRHVTGFDAGVLRDVDRPADLVA